MDTDTEIELIKTRPTETDKPTLAWCTPYWNSTRWDQGKNTPAHWMDQALFESAHWYFISPETRIDLGQIQKKLRILLNCQDHSSRLITCKCPPDKQISYNQSLQMVISKLPDLDGVILDPDSRNQAQGHPVSPLLQNRGQGNSNNGCNNSSLLEIPFIEESSLWQADSRAHFFTRVFAFNRIKHLESDVCTIQKFHKRYKLLLMAHNQVAYKHLGQVASNSEKLTAEEVLGKYKAEFLETLARTTTVPKRTNVLEHIRGYFKKHLSPNENCYLQSLVCAYRQGKVPFKAVTSVFDYVSRQFNDLYMQDQYFLNPYPTDFNPPQAY